MWNSPVSPISKITNQFIVLYGVDEASLTYLILLHLLVPDTPISFY
jgi:hypothetical protein